MSSIHGIASSVVLAIGALAVTGASIAKNDPSRNIQFSGGTSIGPASAAAVRLAAPDLVVTGVEILVMNPGEGSFATGRTVYTHSQVRLRPTFKNIGTASVDVSSVPWQVTKGPYVYTGQMTGSNGGWLSGTLAPGASMTGLLPYFGPGQVIPGTYELAIAIDPANKISEANEANNVLTKSLPILTSNVYSGQPDLRTTATAKENLAYQCLPQRHYDITTVTTNSGTFPAYVYGNSILKAPTGLTTTHNEGYWVLIMPGASKTINYKTSVDYGTTRQFAFMADPMELVREGTDANNFFTLTIDSPAKPTSGTGDLIISDAFFEYTPTNQLYWLVVTVKNVGQGTVTICEGAWSTSTAPAGLEWAGNAPAAPTDLAPGQTWKSPTSAKRSLPSGTFTVSIEVNRWRTIPETNASNNVYNLKVTLPGDVRFRQ